MSFKENGNQMTETMFFVGAGASVPAGIKDVVTLVDELIIWLDSNNPELSKVTRNIIEIIVEWEKNRSMDGYLNIETLLETVERLESSFRDVLPDFFIDRTLRLNEQGSKSIKEKSLSKEIKKFIQISFHKIKDIKYYNALNDFISNYRPLYVFTTNYDLILEQFCEISKKKYSDLFKDSEWNPLVSNPSQFDLILHKLHGSINWYRTERGEYIKAVEKTTKTEIELFNNQKAVPLILYPGKKLEYIEPTLEILNILRKALAQVSCCFVIGYSFKDDHLLKLFLYSANKNQELILFLITPNAHTIYYERLKRYSDVDFPHAFMHESFDENDFNVTIPSYLEGKVICLPYKIQNIFPKLLEYYENLRKGVHIEHAIREHRGKIDPSWAIMSGDSNSYSLMDCLRCFSNCEYFEKIEEIVKSRTDGWDSIINKMAKGQHLSEDIMYILDIFLKSYFNYWSSHQKAAYHTRLLKYLTMINKTFKISIKNNMIAATFELADAELPGYLAYKYYRHLETQFHEYKKTSEIEDRDTILFIQNGKNFFEKWRNGDIELKHYVEKYVTSEPDRKNLIELIQEMELGSEPDANLIQKHIIDAISRIKPA